MNATLQQKLQQGDELFEGKNTVLYLQVVKVLKYAEIAAKQAIKTVAKKGAAKTGGKAIAKAIPVASLATGAFFAWQRLRNGEYLKAVAEVGSGVAGCFPGLGTFAAVAIDVGVLSADVIEEVHKMSGEENPRGRNNAVYMIVCHGNQMNTAFATPPGMVVWFMGSHGHSYNERGEFERDIARLIEGQDLNFTSQYLNEEACHDYQLKLPTNERDLKIFSACGFFLAGVRKIWPTVELVQDLTNRLFSGTNLQEMVNGIRAKESPDTPIVVLCFFCRGN